MTPPGFSYSGGSGRAYFMSAAPLISIVVPCKNPGERLHGALASVWAQRRTEYELIVIDGGSTDGTPAWLDAHRDRIGIFLRTDADFIGMRNEAIAAARGEWVLLFEPDSRLVGDLVLSEAINWLKKTEAGVAVGEVAFDDGRIEKLRSPVNPIAKNFVPLEATLYRRSLFAENGGFENEFAPLSVYELNLRLWKNRVRFKPIPLRLVASRAPKHRFDRRACAAEIRIRHRYFSFGRCVLWDAASLMRCGAAALGGAFRRRTTTGEPPAAKTT